MIGYLNGLIIDIDEKSLILLAGQIGYKVFTPTEVRAKLKVDQKAQLYIHTAVKEDDISLYGFRKKEELLFFEQLLTVSGVGPKMALEILSSPIAMTQKAILGGDADMLTKIKGLGKKTAERIIIDLKSKIVPVSTSVMGGKSGAYNEEAVSALESLGYDKLEVVKFISEQKEEIEDTETLIKAFLKQA